MNALFLGIDIGVQGAIATIDVDGSLIEISDMPVLADGPSGRRSVNGPLLCEIIFRAFPCVERCVAQRGSRTTGAPRRL
jgi:hypothetical protein